MDIERIDQLILRLRDELPIEERVQVSTALFELTGKRYGSDFQAWSKWRSMQGAPSGKSSMVSDLPYVKRLIGLKVLDSNLLTQVDASKLPSEGSPDAEGWDALISKAGRYVTLFESGNFYGDATADQIARVHGKEARVEPVAGGGGRVLCLGANRFELGERAHIMVRRALAFELGDTGSKRLLVDHALRLWLLEEEAYTYLAQSCGFRFSAPDPRAEEHATSLAGLGLVVPDLEFGDEVWLDALNDPSEAQALRVHLGHHGAGARWDRTNEDGFCESFLRWLRQELHFGPIVNEALHLPEGILAVPTGPEDLIAWGQALAERLQVPWTLLSLEAEDREQLWLLKIPRERSEELARRLGGAIPPSVSLSLRPYGWWRRLFGPSAVAEAPAPTVPDATQQASTTLERLIPTDRWADIPRLGDSGIIDAEALPGLADRLAKGALETETIRIGQSGPRLHLEVRGQRAKVRLGPSKAWEVLVSSLNRALRESAEGARFGILADSPERVVYADDDVLRSLPEAGFALIAAP